MGLTAATLSAADLVNQVDAIVGGLTAQNAELDMQLAKAREALLTTPYMAAATTGVLLWRRDTVGHM
jgi:hypothetical protein